MPEATICQVLHGLRVGGAEVLADRMARRLSHRFRFVFACLDELGELGQALRDDGFPVHVLERGRGFDWGCSRRLAHSLREENVDIVHAHQYTPFFYSLMSRIPAGKRPVLFTEHGRFHPDFPRHKRIAFNRLMLRRGDRVAAVGEAVRRAVVDNEGIHSRRVGVIYNGIDLAPFQIAGGDPRQSVRRELGLNAADFVVVLVARLDYLKDHLTAVRTIERVVRELPEVRLLLVGDGPERERIEREIARRSLDAHVRLLGTRRDVPRLLAAADACLLTSISEGIPLTLIEALAAGLPIVSTDVGGVTEVVEQGRTALLAPAGDDERLAAALAELVRRPEMRATMAETGRRCAAEKFCENLMHEQYAELYDEMLGFAKVGFAAVAASVLNGCRTDNCDCHGESQHRIA